MGRDHRGTGTALNVTGRIHTDAFFFSHKVHRMKQQVYRQATAMDHKVPLEKKMQLAQFIRAQNQGNRMKIRQREQILYGTDTQLPLFHNGRLSNTVSPYESSQPPAEQETEAPVFASGTFRYRMILAVLLFVGFLLCDTSDGKIGSYTTNEVHEMITADTFHLYDTEENEVMEGLAAFFLGD